jgi:hypothetical protein
MTDQNNQSSTSKEKPKPPYMREERFDTESLDNLLDSRPPREPLTEQKPKSNKPKPRLLKS